MRGLVSNTLSQGVGIATGLQHKFDWTSVAAAGIAGGVTSEVGSHLHMSDTLSFANAGKSLVAGMAGNIANAATRSVIDGSDFGDNIMAALPDTIANTIGGLIGNALKKHNSGSVINYEPEAPNPLSHIDGLHLPAISGSSAEPDLTAETQNYLKYFGAEIETVDGQLRVTNPAALKPGLRTIRQPGGAPDLKVELAADGPYKQIDDYQYYLDTTPTQVQRQEGMQDEGGVIYTSDTPNASQPISLALMVDGNVTLRLFVDNGLVTPYAGGTERFPGHTVGYGAEPKPHESLAEFNYAHPEFAAALFPQPVRINQPTGESVSPLNPGLFGWSGPLYAYGQRWELARDEVHYGRELVHNADFSFAGLGKVARGVYHEISGSLKYAAVGTTGSVDLLEGAWNGRPRFPNAEDMHTTDLALTLGPAAIAPEMMIGRSLAAESGGIADLGLVELDPNIIRFSQTSPRLQGATVPKLVESMKAKGFVVEPDRLIDVVRMPDGGLTTLDNTRILAASRAGVKVQARVWEHTDLLPNNADFISRFVGRRGEIPQTFGDAVTNRIGNQNSIFRNQYPYGSPFIGSNH